MLRPDPHVPNDVRFDTQPFPLRFPSVTRVPCGEDHRPRSQSADTRRDLFHQERIFPEDKEHDRVHSYSVQSVPSDHSLCASDACIRDDGALRRGDANVIYDEAEVVTLRRSVNSVQFPSTYRERADEQHTPQFNSAAHNFTQHLRERSPSSSSALLNLLSRYPSARQSVYPSIPTASTATGPPRIYRFDDRPVDTHSYRTTDAVPGYLLVELSVPKQEQPSFHTGQSFQRSQSSSLSSQVHLPRSSSVSASVYNSLSYSPTLAPLTSDTDYLDSQRFTNGYATIRSPGTSKEFDNRSEHKFYTDLSNNNHTLSARNKRWEELLDVTQLDSLLASVLEENMNRSTTEWSNSFAQVQNRFKNMPPESSSSGVLHGFTSSGAPTLPRRTMLVSRSGSNIDLKRSESVLGTAVEHRATEAPEMRKSGAIDSFWSHTVNSRPSSPLTQRIAGNLTAAERLQMLHEDSISTIGATNKPGTGVQLAARREHYLQEASSTSAYTSHRETAIRPGTPALRAPSPNFSDLDSAVQELQFGVRSTGYSNSARKLGGCARFPTEDQALSPPHGGTISRHMNSPSPTDSNSETSSIYQTPTGLPHPKPKHNIKEQLSNAGVTSYTFSRTGHRISSSFPVPSTGSVASRITEFEKRPGTPTLQIASAPRQEKNALPSGPMSPKSTVYKSKPVIHIETGSRSPRNLNSTTSVFDFPPAKVSG
ncbi:hypothetical protein NECAME_01900 [Necator americanus]|uniref:Uncharacterized protein n=1 Tax=Necator americanus TaxID=51031 RepID=W2TKJ1_NECAM|nr:hypothetical protein NECAME_01900 [Necator americanus]ETN82615.1 hypothetical protein NECAME_01900 [Necator americanus]